MYTITELLSLFKKHNDAYTPLSINFIIKYTSTFWISSQGITQNLRSTLLTILFFKENPSSWEIYLDVYISISYNLLLIFPLFSKRHAKNNTHTIKHKKGQISPASLLM